MSSRNCQKCGTTNLTSDKFCAKCGHWLAVVAAPPHPLPAKTSTKMKTMLVVLAVIGGLMFSGCASQGPAFRSNPVSAASPEPLLTINKSPEMQTPTPSEADSTGKIVGVWEGFVRYEIRREAGHLILDGGTGEKQTLLEKTVRGRKRLYIPGSLFGDYMVIEKDGRLGLYDEKGFVDALPRTR